MAIGQQDDLKVLTYEIKSVPYPGRFSWIEVQSNNISFSSGGVGVGVGTGAKPQNALCDAPTSSEDSGNVNLLKSVDPWPVPGLPISEAIPVLHYQNIKCQIKST